MPETTDSTEPHMYTFFPYTYIFVVKFNLQISKRLAITNNKIKRLQQCILIKLCECDLSPSVLLYCTYPSYDAVG